RLTEGLFSPGPRCRAGEAGPPTRKSPYCARSLIQEDSIHAPAQFSSDMVERRDLRDVVLDQAEWRAGRRGRTGQQVLSHGRWQAALGDLCRRGGGQPDLARLAWLAAPHLCRAAKGWRPAAQTLG